MTSIEDRTAYTKNPYFKELTIGDFTPFYVAIAICSVIGGLLFILNIICCCCSKHSEYWQDRHTGNRWIVSLWSATPHKQPPLDYTELEKGNIPTKKTNLRSHDIELQKRESDI